MDTTDLTKIPGIGKNIARHLINAGYPSIKSLKGRVDLLCSMMENPDTLSFDEKGRLIASQA